MRAKIRRILAECIENGIERGYARAHKYDDTSIEIRILDEIEEAIWLEIDDRFDFERNLCSEVIEGLDHLPRHLRPKILNDLDQEEVDLKDAVDREWVGLTAEEMVEVYQTYEERKPYTPYAMFLHVEAKLKEKNT
jgi:hypothetical protein